MLKHRQSLISAHHNYLVNNMLSPGFVLGNPDSEHGFYFLANLVLPGNDTPCISARLFDQQGIFILELRQNEPSLNPGRCIYQTTPGGFRILYPSGEPLLEADTQKFTNGYLTRIKGKIYDEGKRLRMEPSYDSIQVHGEANLALDSPL